MIFFFKKSKIHLDCFTDRPDIFDNFPIVKGSKCYPDWWKNLEDSSFDFSTMKRNINMKHCVGLIDFFSQSLSIRLWSDLAVKLINMHGQLQAGCQFLDYRTDIAHHPKTQYQNYFDTDEFFHLKINSPWFFKCKEDIKWVWVGNSWSKNLNNEMIIPPGVLDFKYQNNTNIQFFLKCSKNQSVEKIFYADTPIVNFFPMSEKKVVVHNHLLSSEELKNIHHRNVLSFVDKQFYRKKNLIKDREKQSKCPFGFK